MTIEKVGLFEGPNCGFKSFYYSWNWKRWKIGYLKDETVSEITISVWRNLWIGPLLITNRVVTLRPEEDVQPGFEVMLQKTLERNQK